MAEAESGTGHSPEADPISANTRHIATSQMGLLGAGEPGLLSSVNTEPANLAHLENLPENLDISVGGVPGEGSLQGSGQLHRSSSESRLSAKAPEFVPKVVQVSRSSPVLDFPILPLQHHLQHHSLPQIHGRNQLPYPLQLPHHSNSPLGQRNMAQPALIPHAPQGFLPMPPHFSSAPIFPSMGHGPGHMHMQMHSPLPSVHRPLTPGLMHAPGVHRPGLEAQHSKPSNWTSPTRSVPNSRPGEPLPPGMLPIAPPAKSASPNSRPAQGSRQRTGSSSRQHDPKAKAGQPSGAAPKPNLESIDDPKLAGVKEKLLQQVEFYFSDQNLPTDNFLLKYVAMDPEGFVPIGVVASFRKVRQLVPKSVSQVSVVSLIVSAIRGSSKLVVSEDEQKVRRAEPLVDVDYHEIQARTVVAENLPAEHSIQAMETLFARVGRVKMVRVCQPQAANSANQTANKNPRADMVVSNKLHALVEFESVEEAEKAVAELTDASDWRIGLHVRLLVRGRRGKAGYQSAQAGHKGKRGGGPNVDPREEGEAPADAAEGPHADSAGEASDSAKDGEDGARMRVGSPSGPEDIGRRQRGTRAGTRGKGHGRGRGPLVGTPPKGSLLGTSPLGQSDTIHKPPPGPRMPDGTRGFTMGRGKMLAHPS